MAPPARPARLWIMSDAVLSLLEQAMGSPWLYAGVLVLAALDAVVPMVPSETAVVTGGVFAATGQPEMVGLVAAAASGAVAGDHLSYFLGRRTGRRLHRPGSRPGRLAGVLERTSRALERRGPMLLVVSRYVPGGRTATTLTMGAIRYPLRMFTPVDLLAGVSWAVYCAGVGYLGGAAFADHPLRGVALGVGLALGVTAVIEGVLLLRRRRSPVPADLPARQRHSVHLVGSVREPQRAGGDPEPGQGRVLRDAGPAVHLERVVHHTLYQ
jgi:membrane protein DedA with SNARE-associated domain